ncbi:MAG: hypothetical protein M5R42_05545 [Rhodocyclaceae bacterium]|nr:hypothetical protein [Rhodocyclaceae bacterium]
MIAVSGEHVGTGRSTALAGDRPRRFHVRAHPGGSPPPPASARWATSSTSSESELGGAIHWKGVMILSVFRLALRAACQLSLTASLCSSSRTARWEGDVPRRGTRRCSCCGFSRPVAGHHRTVNQYGRVQPIGGV